MSTSLPEDPVYIDLLERLIFALLEERHGFVGPDKPIKVISKQPEGVQTPKTVVELVDRTRRARELPVLGLEPVVWVGASSTVDHPCDRCGSLIKNGRCTNTECPFVDHAQSCLMGWYMHESHPHGKCNCKKKSET